MSTNEKLDFVRKNEKGTIQYYVPPQTGKLLSDNWMDILLSGSFAGFDTEKNVTLIERIVNWITGENDVILDSFAGSGTTAHAVLKANAADGGHRKFILVELMDYADTITTERVKRVINGYGEGKSAVPGIPGDFSFYELGAPLFIGDNLNEDVGIEKIRAYVYFTETRQRIQPSPEPYYLGSHVDNAYYFYYERNQVTVLNRDYLCTIKVKAENYVIYADQCVFTPDELNRYHVTFKKIPRDISRL